jgi:DNA-directed RNA polymerase subunit beta'
LHECGLPKDMAAELFKPFIIRKMIERGVVKTVKSAKKIVDRKDPIVWDILENVLKGHPVLLNRAPTLHRLGIQSFQPKLVEGKAIQLHPLVCTAFNADFDGDQMAVHLPLGNAAILEAQMLMLASHNILNPANGTPITVPSQDMVLGLYYITKGRRTDEGRVVLGQDQTFYSPEEVIIAYNERKIDLHAFIKVKAFVKEKDGSIVNKIIETTVGRVLFNQRVPVEVGYINELLTKKSLRDIIGDVVKNTGMARAAQFLDDIKELGFQMAFQGGLSFNLQDLNIPAEKAHLIDQASKEVEEVMNNYNMGFITNNERYNQIIDIWTRINNRLTANVMNQLSSDNQGFNSVYMMLDSGARGSKEQIRQLCGMRGLMAKPQKSGSGGEIIENPILSNFKEGLSVLEYFISTHGARKGLADTALKTADAGYLTRRLHDVAQDMIVGETDCGTLRGIYTTALKDNEDVVEPLYDRILGRTSLHDVYDPLTNELLVSAGEDIEEHIAVKIENSPLEGIEIRSVLTCESKRGVCALCYGRNLATGKRVQMGEAVGVIAAQSIGEPGTQLTLRTFHVGGTASNIAAESQINAKFDGVIEFENVRTVSHETTEGTLEVVLGRSGEFRIVEPGTNKMIMSNNIPYGAFLYVKDGAKISKGDKICSWDPYNAVIISEFEGKAEFEAIIEGVTFREESDEQTGHREKVIIDTRDKTKNPVIRVADKKGNGIKGYNIPVGAHIAVEENEKVKIGQIIAKIPRSTGKTRDITGGLPRVTELFEARNPSNPAVVTEIDGVVTLGGVKRGNREMSIESKDGQVKKYLVPLSKHILVQDNDFVKAGMPLSDGSISPADILSIKGPAAVQEYLVNGIQEVYRLQGVKINDKHFETIVHQMMQKVMIEDAGDTRFLEKELVDRWDFQLENDEIYDKRVVIDPGESVNLKSGQIISVRKLRDENSVLKRKDMKLIETRDAIAATSSQMLQGITRASLGTKSFISAASFQETTKVLNEAAISGKRDNLLGLKENVIVGHLIPSGTGLRQYERIIVGSQDEYDKLMASKQEELEA